MNIDVFTLFPAWFDWFKEQRHVRNALALSHELNTVDLRATTPLSAGQVDDTPYGGGAGMVVRVDVVEAALAARYGGDPIELPATRRVIALAPGGRPFDEALASELAAEPALTLLCGRYEGFDERVHEHLASDVISIGPYVLSGGELAAMVVCDAVIRKLPGALGHEESALEAFDYSAHGKRRAPELGGLPGSTRSGQWYRRRRRLILGRREIYSRPSACGFVRAATRGSSHGLRRAGCPAPHGRATRPGGCSEGTRAPPLVLR